MKDKKSQEKVYVFILGCAVTLFTMIFCYCWSQALQLTFPDHGGVQHLTHVVTVTKYVTVEDHQLPEPRNGDVEAAIKIIKALPLCTLNWNKNPITGEAYNDFYCTNVDFSVAAPAVCRITQKGVNGERGGDVIGDCN